MQQLQRRTLRLTLALRRLQFGETLDALRLRARGSSERAAQALAREDAAPVPLPIEPAEARQDRERIQAALASLPPEQRTVLELAYFEGLTQSEIAARTGDALGTIKTRCRLALQKLAGALAEGGR